MNDINLSKRLSLCASFVPLGSTILDIGTDHAYLPIYLAQKGIINHAIASDLNVSPLKKAKKNIDKFNLQNVVTTQLSDGAKSIDLSYVDTIIIAGMGGELICDILNGICKQSYQSITFILQPMTKDVDLRNFLKANNFTILQEKAVIDFSHVYTVMKVKSFSNYDDSSYVSDSLYPYIGKLDVEFLNNDTIMYINKVIKRLKDTLNSDLVDKKYISATILKLEQILERGVKNGKSN